MFLFQSTAATQTAVKAAELAVDATKLVKDTSNLITHLHSLANDSTFVGNSVEIFEEAIEMDKW